MFSQHDSHDDEPLPPSVRAHVVQAARWLRAFALLEDAPAAPDGRGRSLQPATAADRQHPHRAPLALERRARRPRQPLDRADAHACATPIRVPQAAQRRRRRTRAHNDERTAS